MQNITVEMESAKFDRQDNNVNKRSTYLDIVKAFAIICVVFGHCIQYGSGSNYLKNDLFLDNIVFKIIYSFHMQLFMLVSGYLFAYSTQRKKWIEIMVNRIQTLLIPILLCYLFHLIMVGAYALVSGEPDISTVLENCISMSSSNLWFLWAVFWCSIVVSIVNRFFSDSKWIYVLGFILTFFITDAHYLNLYKFMYPYFVLGYFYNKDGYTTKLKKIYNHSFTLIIVGVLFVVLLLFYNRDAYIYTTGHCVLGKGVLRQIKIDIYRLLIGAIGSTFVLLIFYQLKSMSISALDKMLKFIGVNTLGIYIISGFVFSYVLTRVTSGMATINYIITIMEAVMVLAFSLACTYIIKKSKYLNKFLLGGRA